MSCGRALVLRQYKMATKTVLPTTPPLQCWRVNKATLRIRVETRDLGTASIIGSIQFFNQNWRAIDIVVVDDLNGDGDSSDSAIGVLAERLTDGRIQLQLREFETGNLLTNTVYLNVRWKAIAAAVAKRAGLLPVIGVIAHNEVNAKRDVTIAHCRHWRVRPKRQVPGFDLELPRCVGEP